MQISKQQTLHPLSIDHKMQIQTYLHYHNYTKAVKLETTIFNKNFHQIQKNHKKLGHINKANPKSHLHTDSLISG